MSVVIKAFDADGELKSLQEVERAMICTALAFTDGNPTHAARALKIGRSTLYRRMDELCINPVHFRGSAGLVDATRGKAATPKVYVEDKSARKRTLSRIYAQKKRDKGKELGMTSREYIEEEQRKEQREFGREVFG